MIRPTTRRPRTSESGASAVEFALVLPVLLLFIYGIIAFGFVFSQQIALNNAARDASRAGVVQPLSPAVSLTCQEVADRARQGMSTAVGISATSLTTVAVAIQLDGTQVCSMASGSTTASNPTLKPCTGATTTSNLTVLTTFQSTTPVPLPVVNNISLKSSGVFACEYQ